MSNEKKVALITGSSRGIGKAIALDFAKTGFTVILNNNKRTEEALALLKEIESKGYSVRYHKADVIYPEQVNDMVKQIVDKFGRIDVLVNNAAINLDRSFNNMEKKEWDDVISTNLTGVFNCVKPVITYMKEQKWGRIINISSVVGQMGNVGQANYSASKAGLIGLTKTLAREYAKYGITVNAVAPGFIDTEMTRNIPEKIKLKIIENIPLARFGKVHEVAKLVSFLASEDAEYITGQVFSINGGVYM